MALQDEDRRILEAHDDDIEAHVAIIADEFRTGFEIVERIDRPGVTIFGSARVREGHAAYDAARELGRRFAGAGFAVITGGGPGAMEAANRGCEEAGGLSIGFNVALPHEQEPNAYLDVWHTFGHFYSRKVMLVKPSEGFVLLPGGFGTLDELFEALTLIQTGKVLNFPVVLFGSDFWKGLIDWIRERPLAEGTISPEDLDLLFVTDDYDEAVATIIDCYERRCAEPPAEPRKAAAE